MSEPIKKLRRLPALGQITGVCAGIAEYTSIDVTIIRILTVVLTIMTSGSFVIVYIIAAIMLPSTSSSAATTPSVSNNLRELTEELQRKKQHSNLRSFFGIGLLLLGTWLLFQQLYPNLIDHYLRYIWPVILIVLGIVIALRRKW